MFEGAFSFDLAHILAISEGHRQSAYVQTHLGLFLLHMLQSFYACRLKLFWMRYIGNWLLYKSAKRECPDQAVTVQSGNYTLFPRDVNKPMQITAHLISLDASVVYE